MKKIITIIIPLLFLSLFLVNCGKSSDNEYPVAWSHYTGWEPWDYADNSGILKKWADKYKIKIKLVRVNDYIESINLFTAKKYYGCTMTNMDALTIPSVGGIDSTALIIGDFSNGNDGIVAKKEKSILELKGKEIKLVQYSVSHYLLSRAFSLNNMKEKEVTLVNTSDADIGSLFISENDGVAVTWNPILMNIAKTKGVNKIFDSSKIPGEIIDMMVVHTDAPEALKKALTGAWFETMAMLKDKNEKKKAVEYMAKNSGATVSEFEEQLGTTAMFYNPADAAEFAKSKKIKETMEYVRSFSFDKGLYGQGATSKDYVGIEFPDGTVIGDKTNVKLRFDAKYMQMAADKKL